MNLVVLGSGGWGTAIALLLHKNANAVTLWSHNAEKAEEMRQSRYNPLLQNVSIPKGISITNDLNCLKTAELVVFAPPSFALRAVAKQAAPYLPAGAVLLSVTKGIERGTHLRMSQVIAQETGGAHPLAVLSGPSHAEEVARGIPTGVVAASADEQTARLVQTLFTNDDFRVYTHDDVVGVELAGALKNVAALCCGVSDGYGLGDNTKALLITRAMAETSRLAERLGGRKETLAGLAGMGDLIVTCTSRHSRNRRAGIAIGEGRAPQEVIADMGGVVEGYYAAVSAKELADAMGVEMPICSAVYNVLYHDAAVDDMIRRLMRRAPKRETDNKWV